MESCIQRIHSYDMYALEGKEIKEKFKGKNKFSKNNRARKNKVLEDGNGAN